MCDTKLSLRNTYVLAAFLSCCLSLLLMNCKVPSYNFRAESVVDSAFVNTIPARFKVKGNNAVLSIEGFKAVITEKFVNNNSVAEYMLINEFSQKKAVNISTSRYRNELYFYECRFQEEVYGILLSATFSDTSNIGAGPIYIGLINDQGGAHKFLASQMFTLKMDECKTPVLQKSKLGSELRFMYVKEPAQDGEIKYVNFYQVLEVTRSKISGTVKVLIFDIEEIFNDSNALKLTRYYNR